MGTTRVRPESERCPDCRDRSNDRDKWSRCVCPPVERIMNNRARKLLDLIETSITDYIQGTGLKAKSLYWIDQLQGPECKIALVIYHAGDQGQQEYSLEQVFTQALLTALSKYIKPNTVKEIQSGGIQFQPISNQPIEADRILVIDSNGITQFWGDFIK